MGLGPRQKARGSEEAGEQAGQRDDRLLWGHVEFEGPVGPPAGRCDYIYEAGAQNRPRLDVSIDI